MDRVPLSLAHVSCRRPTPPVAQGNRDREKRFAADFGFRIDRLLRTQFLSSSSPVQEAETIVSECERRKGSRSRLVSETSFPFIPFPLRRESVIFAGEVGRKGQGNGEARGGTASVRESAESAVQQQPRAERSGALGIGAHQRRALLRMRLGRPFRAPIPTPTTTQGAASLCPGLGFVCPFGASGVSLNCRCKFGERRPFCKGAALIESHADDGQPSDIAQRKHRCGRCCVQQQAQPDVVVEYRDP